MRERPLISVCINCYNAEATIEATVRSVCAQTYENLQIIVVDDCSTDRSLEIIRTIEDERIEVYPLPKNGHIANANNECLRHVRGEFVAHVDADDQWLPDKLEKQWQFLNEHSEYGACFTTAEMVDEEGNPVDDERYRLLNLPQPVMLRQLLRGGNYLCHSALLARREVMDAVGQHDRSLLYFHDYDYWVRMVTHCPVYILPEKQTIVRLSSTSNSHMSEAKQQAHVNEFAQIAYRSIVSCPDDLFLQAFADELRRPGDHTPEQTAWEKAFVLLNMIVYLPGNRALGLRRMAELFAEEGYARVAEEDFGFTPRDFYALSASFVYDDERVRDRLATAETAVVQLEGRQEELTAETARLTEAAASLTAEKNALAAANAILTQQLASASAAHENAAAQLRLIAGSKSWRLTAPLRALSRMQQINRTAAHPKLKTGEAAACKVMLYGYYGHNLGDDLFFDTLLHRYPDTIFTLSEGDGYEAFFARYPNAYAYAQSNAHVQKLNAFGAKLHKERYFEKLLRSKCDAVVHIGGSIYQQVGTWEEDLRIRKERYDRRRPFFSISSNFGPYQTDEYRLFWREQFQKCRDICFRDKDSYELFKDIPSVRYAPDLLFAQPLPTVPVTPGQTFLSIFDPTFRGRGLSEETCSGYMNTVVAVIRELLRRGQRVVVSDFCWFENAGGIEAMIAQLSEEERQQVAVVNYTGDGNFEPVLTAIAASERVIATRFHAMLFGFIGGKKTLPIVYNPKMRHQLDDLAFAGASPDVETFARMSVDEVLAALDGQPIVDATAWKAQAVEQFAALDRYIEEKGGRVVPAT
ncbi:MAG: glycosyltransferase [Clostridia bacterium]|nr:glycosyltransferase [Clostridia bacterium]